MVGSSNKRIPQRVKSSMGALSPAYVAREDLGAGSVGVLVRIPRTLTEGGPVIPLLAGSLCDGGRGGGGEVLFSIPSR